MGTRPLRITVEPKRKRHSLSVRRQSRSSSVASIKEEHELITSPKKATHSAPHAIMRFMPQKLAQMAAEPPTENNSARSSQSSSRSRGSTAEWVDDAGDEMTC